MSDLVRAILGDQEVNVSPAYAEAKKLEVLDGEPTHRPDGRPRPPTARGGRPIKNKTTVAQAAAAKKATSRRRSPKKAAAPAAAKKAAETTAGSPQTEQPSTDKES